MSIPTPNNILQSIVNLVRPDPDSKEHPQAWRQISSSKWEQPLDGASSFNLMMAKHPQWKDSCGGKEMYSLNVFATVHFGSTLNLEDVPKKLKDAWRLLRFQQPNIATTADPNTYLKTYVVPTGEEEVSEWVEGSFTVLSDVTSVESGWGQLEPAPLAMLCWVPASRQILLRLPHWMTDGVGLVMLMGELLRTLAEDQKKGVINWGEEVSRLGPTLEHIWDITEPSAERAKYVDDIFESWGEGMPGVGPPSTINKSPPVAPALSELTFSPNLTETIITAAKEHDLTVTQAIHAAFILAIRDLADPSLATKDYYSIADFDLRRWLPLPFSSSQYGANMYYTNWPMTIPLDPSSTFTSVAPAVQRYYTDFGDDPTNKDLVGHYGRKLFDFTKTEEYHSSHPSHDAQLSSLGVLDEYINTTYGSGGNGGNGVSVEVEVTDVKVAEMNTGWVPAMFSSTFNGRLRFSYCWNRGMWEEGVVVGLMERTKEILERELLGET